jgi:tetratricopeptide (TPR) repeat protein
LGATGRTPVAPFFFAGCFLRDIFGRLGGLWLASPTAYSVNEACLETAVKSIPNICLAVLLLGALQGCSLCQAQPASGLKATAQGETTSQLAGAVQRALAMEQQAKYPEAEAAWESVVKLEPRNAQAYAHLGLLEARQEHYPQAVTDYRKAQALAQSQNKAIPQLNLNLGLALFKSENFQEAGRLFEAELRKHPDAAEAPKLATLAAMSHYGAHQYGAAIPYLKDAVAADPRNLSLLLALAHCYLWTKQLDATLDVYKQILLIDPDSAAADMIAGEALDEKGDNAGAVQQFQAAVKANPKEPNVHFALAYLLWAQKRYDEAIPEFKAELENDPKNYQAMIYLGDTYVQQSQFAEAKPMLESANQFQTSVPLIHLDLGIVYMETGNQDGAVTEMTKTVAMEPDNVTAHFRLANLYRTMGKKDEAKAEFAKASSLNKKRDNNVHERIAAANAHAGGDPKPAPPEKPDTAAKPDQQ